MVTTDEFGRPPDALAVASRYLRRERPLTGIVAALAISIFLGTYYLTTLLPAIVVAAIIILAARAPILHSRGTVRLRTDADVATVVTAFTGPTPPILALQWGIATEVTLADAEASYRLEYLFGLRATEVAVQSRSVSIPPGAYLVELQATVADHPWGTYTAAITAGADHTVVDVAYTADRRLGLRRLPQSLLAVRYRDAVLEAQGYTVLERDSHIGL